jgi:PAS domain S-box-containing protein
VILSEVKMKLRIKTLMLIGILFMTLILVLFVISQTIFLNTFNEHEKQYTSLEVTDVNYTLNNEISNLKKINMDWAEWDDTYSFVGGDYPGFVENNVLPETFERLNVNLILFLDKDRQIVYGKAVNLEENKEISFPSNLNRTLSSDDPLIGSNSSEGTAGIIITQYGPMIISSQPILTSSGDGPAQGTLIMGRFLGQTELNRLSNITNSSVSLEDYNDSNMPPDFQKARFSLTTTNPIFVQALGPNSIAGYISLNDIYGNPALILKTEIPRVIYQDYQGSIIYLIASLILLGLLFGVLTLYYLDKNILNRLEKIVSGVVKIGETDDLSKRVYAEGDDELANLGRSINETFDSLEKSEYKLRESEERYRNIFENTGTSMLILDEDLNVFLVNKEFENVFGFFEKKLEAKMNWIDLIAYPDNDKIWNYHNKILNERKISKIPETYELELKNKRGEIGDFLATFNNIPNTERILVSLIDISDRKKAENEIKSSLKEKETLLREIHHRVKNNMQIISSLISLQSAEVSDEKLVSLYKETENRIHSMALVHENLYQSHDLSHIGLSQYVQNLVEDLIYSYGVSNAIETEIEVPPIEVNLETAIPLGLIINEMVSNSIKHAFPDKKGKIMVKLEIDSDENLILMVSDDGVGLPKDSDIDSIKKFGLKLIQALIQQLDGKLTFESKNGTTFCIKFKELEYGKRF